MISLYAFFPALMRFDVSLPEQEKILQFIFVKSLERKQKRPYAAVILRHMGAFVSVFTSTFQNRNQKN